MASLLASDISSLIACRKKRAELLFKKNYLLWTSSQNERLVNEIDSELVSVDTELENLQGKVGKLTIILPDQEKLEELNNQLLSFEQSELYKAMKEKEGKIYALIKERGELLKYIFEKREEIAKLNIILEELKGKDKKSIMDMLRNRSNFSEEHIEKLKDQKIKAELFKLFARMDFPVSEEKAAVKEEKVFVGSKSLWVPSSLVPKVKDLNENIGKLSNKIQLMNAHKQIKQFSEFEEKEFESMQNQYLSLLKEQDKILNNFG